jgi:hypothetical protein
MLKRNKQRNIKITKAEEERLLWHGVSGNHPKIIYEGMKEAFDVTYSRKVWIFFLLIKLLIRIVCGVMEHILQRTPNILMIIAT